MFQTFEEVVSVIYLLLLLDPFTIFFRIFFVIFYQCLLWYSSICSENFVGSYAAVGIAAPYGLDGPGSKTGRGEIFRTRPDRLRGPPSFLYVGYRVFPGGKPAGSWR